MASERGGGRKRKNENWAGRLHQAGLRVTRPRRLVLDLLAGRRGHHSADDVARALATQGTPLGRTSVYNVVSALAAKGLLTLTEVGPGCARYELATERHHHFICRRCGAILDVPCPAGGKPCCRPRNFAGEVDETQVILRGTCPDCLALRDNGKRGNRSAVSRGPAAAKRGLRGW